MKAVVCQELGPADKLVIGELPSPKCPKGHVRIKVAACGVNFPDALIIEGKYQFKPEPPFAPGGEVSGTIAELGEGVSNFKIGDRVLALCGHGGFAEEVVVPAMAAAPIPDAMSFEEAAGFIMTYGTSHHALKQRAQLKEGETLVVMGAAGGVGITAVELGKLMGAKVIAAASSDEKLEFAKSYGADELVNYSETSIKDAIKGLTGGQGADVIYDPVGGELCEQAFRAIGWNGRYLVIGFVAGIPKFPTNLALLKGASLVGVFWGAFTMREPKVHQDNVKELLTWYATGKLKPAISKVYDMEDAPEAIKALSERRAQGKLVVKIS